MDMTRYARLVFIQILNYSGKSTLELIGEVGNPLVL